MSARTLALAAAAGLVLAAPAGAQTLAERVRQAPDGVVRFHYEPIDGVCGTARGGIQVRNEDGTSYSEWNGRNELCDEGPVHVALEKANRSVAAIRIRVGPAGAAMNGRVTDLGEVAPQAAADFLLDLAENGPSSVAKKAIFPATLARGVTVWPTLLRMARADAILRDTRKQAIFWLGQAAAEQATRGLAELVGDDAEESEIRKHAVFALSQRPGGEGVPFLLEAARSNRDPEVRKAAFFWLAESDDPRALALFEEVLRKG